MKLNYKHLRYFYAVAESLSIKVAAKRLNLTPQTISGQLKMLEDQLGEDLFRKSGRGLELTEAGQVALEYCNEIFRLGDELQEVLHQGLDSRAEALKVGIVDALPKSIAQRILAPILKDAGNMRLICREEQMTALLGELAVHRLDLVLADSPIPPGMNIRCFNHVLARSPITCFAAPELLSTGLPFPQCLQDAPVLLPTDTSSAMRTNLLSWLQRQQIKVRIAGEFDDSALMKAFGSQGHGFFFAPQMVTREICERYDVKVAGDIPELEQTVYGIVAERRMMHSALKGLSRSSQDK